jgi:methionyl-tRNA synthetase
MKKRYLITSALPYANGPLHIGHLAGAYLPADIFARWLRLMGKEVVFVCGSDEHGAAITMRALTEGTTPQAIVDKYDAVLRETFEKIGVSFDIYHRTSSPLHHETSQDFFRKLLENDQFEVKEKEQLYDETAGQFLADRYIVGTCPICANKDAYGDQCEKCGSSLSPTDLINPKSKLSGSKPVFRPTKHWYLKLNTHEIWLREWINSGNLKGKNLHDPADWKAHVLGQCNSWLDSGLQPRAMTRDLDWGVDVPQELDGAKGKKLYVWLDAPIGYISATKQWAADNGKDWKKYWQDDDSALVHFIGKDNIVFHCLIFPAILKAHGDFILPENVPANQFMNLEGRKISTSRNWAIWVHEFVQDFPGQEDVLRYSMVKNMPEQKDADFSWKSFQETNNNELVNNFGNFVQRVNVLTHKYYDGLVPKIDPEQVIESGIEIGKKGYFDTEMRHLHQLLEAMGAQIKAYNFREAVKILLEISTFGNQLLQFNEPWKTFATEPEKVKVVLNLGLQIAAALSVACRPFLPFSSNKLRKMLQLPAIEEQGELLAILNELIDGKPILPNMHQIGVAEHLFSRISDEFVAEQVEKLMASNPTPAIEKTVEIVPEIIVEPSYETLKETIEFIDFSKIDLRAGVILTAEKMPKTKKLLKLSIDLGFETRTIVSGIAEHFSPEAIIGKSVLVLVNLAPRTLAGVESQGMILMAEDGAKKLHFVSPTEMIGGGWTVK